MRILYLSPLIPAPSGNGGKRAVYNHLEDVMRSSDQIDLVAVDVEARGEALPTAFASLNGRVFQRALPPGRSLRGLLAAARQWLFDGRPRAAAVVASEAARKAVRTAIAATRYDAVIVDHLNAWSLIDDVPIRAPIVYLAHNVESDVLADQYAQYTAWSLRRWQISAELRKMERYEKGLLRRADAIVAIAASDCASPLLQLVRAKTVVWPELPSLKTPAWSASGTRSLLFVGSAAYFPNRDAIEWLVSAFMPTLARLAPDVTLRIAGTARAEVADLDAPYSVLFEGFVSEARLDELHRISDVFVCPVVLGSGIKIKVLEASSYGLPVAATAESLRGIDYLAGASLQINRESEAAARAVVALLNDRGRLVAASERALHQLQQARTTRRSLLATVEPLTRL